MRDKLILFFALILIASSFAWWNASFVNNSCTNLTQTSTSGSAYFNISAQSAIGAEIIFTTNASGTETECGGYWAVKNDTNASIPNRYIVNCSVSNGMTQLCYYYGNTSAVGLSSKNNLSKSCYAGDDFNDASANSGIWTTGGSPTFANSVMTLDNSDYIVGKSYFASNNKVLESYAAIGSATYKYSNIENSAQTNFMGYYIDTVPNGGAQVKQSDGTVSKTTITWNTSWVNYRTVSNTTTGNYYRNNILDKTDTSHHPSASMRIDQQCYACGADTFQLDWTCLYDLTDNTGLNFTYSAWVNQTTAAPAPPSTGTIDFQAQTPSDITSTNLFAQDLNITYNSSIGDLSLNYTVNSTARTNIFFVNGTATSLINRTMNYTQKNGVNYSFTLDGDYIYPATYNINESVMETTVHSILNLNNQNDLVKIELLNVSNNTPNNFLEIMGMNETSSTTPAELFYCNSSYSTGDPSMTANCYQFGALQPGPYNHSHSQYSNHTLNLVPLNSTTGLIGTVKVTPVSYFLVRGALLGVWDVYYIANTARTTATATSNTFGVAWTGQTYTIDAHLHQFDADDTIYYFATNGTAGGNSSTRSDLFNLDPLSPSAPGIFAPTAGVKYGSIPINYTASTPSFGTTLSYYNITLLTSGGAYVQTLQTNNSLNLSYLWDSSALTTPTNYTVKVQVCDSNSKCAFDVGPIFELSNFLTTLQTPHNGDLLSGNTTLINYTTTNIHLATCTVLIDGAIVDTQLLASASNVSITKATTSGSHTLKASCQPVGDPYTSNSSTITFSMNYITYTYLLNLTTVPQNVMATPQGLFYDVNGSLNVLYQQSIAGSYSTEIKTISNNQLITNYSQPMNNSKAFMLAFREPVNTTIYLFDTNNATRYWLNLNGGVNLTNLSTTHNILSNITFNYDPYTYAYSKQYATVPTTGGAYVFILPDTTGSVLVQNNLSSSTFTTLNIINNLSAHVQWQTIVNNSAFDTWYFAFPENTTLVAEQITLYSVNISTGTITKIATPNNTALNLAQIEGSSVVFENYGGTTYMFIGNTSLGSAMIYQIGTGYNYTIPNEVEMPSHFLFITNDTFVFFSTESGTTYAYSCLFNSSSPTCTKLSSSDYGFSVPYNRGPMTTATRNGTSDIIAKGIILSGSVVQLSYNLNTYDAKFLCYDEVNEYRKVFKMNIVGTNTTQILNTQIWGYVIPSASMDPGLKRLYTNCTGGTVRLFLQGLNNNYRLDLYSLNIPQGTYYTFIIKDSFGQTVEGAKITALRFSTAKQSYVVIEQGITDVTGSATLFLQPYNTYSMIIENAGYATMQFAFTPVGLTTININLQTGQQILLPNASYVFNDVTFSLNPQTYYTRNATNLTYTIISNSAGLQWYSMNITKQYNSTVTNVFWQNITTQPNGGILMYDMNTTGTYLVDVCFKHQNYSAFCPPTVIYVYGGNTSFNNAMQNIQQFPISGFAYYLVAVIIAMVVVGFVSKYTVDGAGLLGLAVLWAFTVINPGLVIFAQLGIAVTVVHASILTTVGVIAALYLRSYI